MTEQDSLRNYLRERALSSLYFFCKFVLGYKDMTPSFHGPICRYLESNRQFKLVVLPRGHLKSSIGTIGKTLWRTTKDPNRRTLISNATATNASHFLRTIKAIVETNEIYRWLFPEVIPETGTTKWTETELEFKRTRPWPESSIESIGVGGTVVSRHYDEIIEDDLIAPEDGFVTAEQVAKVIEWHKYATSLAVDPGVFEQTIIGTRWLYDDFIAYIFEKEKWFLPAYYRSVVENGRYIWPERFKPEVVDRILEQQGPKIFSCQYMNAPVHEDARSFDQKWFRFYTKWPPRDENDRVTPTLCVTAIDPAISQKKHGDYTAIVTVAATPNRDLYVVDVRKDRWGIDEQIDQVFDVFQTWHPRRIGLETVMFQKALMYPYREAMRRRGINLPLVELRPSSKITKEARIQALHEYFANGSLWLNRDHKVLLDELRGFPAIAHDDVVDALAYAIQMIIYPSEVAKQQFESPFSFEALTRELRLRNVPAGPWLWHGDKPAEVLGATYIPQTAEEIRELLDVDRV